MANPFKNKIMRAQYEAALEAFRIKHRDLFRPDGSQNRGSSFASNFWHGYNGTTLGAGFIDRDSKSTIAYAYYRAGQDAKKQQESK